MYSSPSIRVDTVKDLNWYLARDVLKYVHQLRKYVLQTPGKLSVAYLPSLTPCDNSKLFHSRFPSGQYFICEGIGDWNDQIQRIQLLASIVTNTNRVLRGYEDINTIGEAEFALLGGINQVIQSYEGAESFIDQAEFEDRYELTWNHLSPKSNQDDQQI